jgi:DNA-binding beta-propeller fold protein YncE
MIANIREEINKPGMLTLHHEIESVIFVSLEETEDDASLIDGVYDYAVTEKYIYVLPVKEQRIVLFDRQGHFIKTLINQGQGPGEFTGVTSMQVDEKNNRLYLFSNRILVFTMEGEFVEYIPHDYQAIFEHKIGDNHYAAVAFPYLPFQSGSFGIGIFSGRGETVSMKNDFHSNLVPDEKAGFTVGLTTPAYSAQSQSVLFKTGSNDTLFRISAEKIQPVCVLDLQNSDNEIIRSLDATDFSSLRKQQPEGKDIYVADMFETPKSYYFRLLYNSDYYVVSTDKRTGKTFVEKCIQPGNLRELADVNLQRGMIGSRSYRNFPIWGRMEGEHLVQIVTPYELTFFKDNNSITIPENLSVNEEGNPIFIFYKIKKIS